MDNDFTAARRPLGIRRESINIHKKMLTFDQEFFNSLHAETDRACVVLGSALLEAKLEGLCKRKLRCFHEELLESSRPLGSFSSQIKLARALDWINDDARADLDTVRSIRNKFAHSANHLLSFGDQSVTDRCKNLRTAQAYLEGYKIAASAPNQQLGAAAFEAIIAAVSPPRWLYEHAITYLSQYLDQITAQTSGYTGPDLLAEVRSVTARCGQRQRQASAVPQPELS